MKGLAVVLLACLIAWEYAPARRGGFVYEDYHTTDACANAEPSGRLATRASWCWQLGQSMWAFHAMNLGLHLVVTALVGWLAWTLTRDSGVALLTAAFFGLNAVHVEAVAYLSGRSELIAAIGVVGACLAALHRRWVLVLPLMVVGWDGKESAIVAVMLAPLCLWYTRRRAWGWATVGIGVLLGLAILWRTAAWWTYPGTPAHGAWALLQTTAIARVFVLSVLPFGQTVDYDYMRVPMVLEWFAASCLVAGLIWAAIQRRRLLWCGAAWIVCATAPRLLVPTPASVFSEHQFYLPLVGVSLILASLLTQESHDHYRAAL